MGLPSFVAPLLKKIAPEFAGYKKKKFHSDLGAGLTVGIIALPLSLALAIATGVPPILGLYTAAIAGALAALFAGSPYSVSGPAAAMVPLLAAIIQKYGFENLPYIGILAALFLLLFALLGLGKLMRFVPESVVLGFTAGVATVIFASQLNSFLGLSGLAHHEHFADKTLETITHLGTASLPTILLGALAILILLFGHKLPVIGKAPTALIAVVSLTLLAMTPIFSGVATLGSVYGQLPLGLPGFNAFNFDAAKLTNTNLLIPGIELAALIAIETLLCAMVASKLTKTKHRPNQELFAQGIANLGSIFFGGIPATAVIARTGTIIKSGAKSRLAALIHAGVVLAFIVALAPVAAFIPLTVLSAVLLVTAVKIAEVKEVARFVRTKSWRLTSVLAATLLLTVFTDLVIGVGVGMLLHIILTIHTRFSRKQRDHDGKLRLAEEEIV